MLRFLNEDGFHRSKNDYNRMTQRCMATQLFRPFTFFKQIQTLVLFDQFFPEFLTHYLNLVPTFYFITYENSNLVK